MHVPGAGGATLGAQPAMQADVLVLHHDAPGLEPFGDIEVLVVMRRGRLQPLPQILFLAILCEGDAIHRADVDAGVAFDAGGRREHGLHVAVQAALRLAERELDVIAELDLGADVLQRDHLVAMRHLVALVAGDVVVVAPLVDAHLLRRDMHFGKRPLGDVFARDHLVDRQRGIMAVRHRPDDVLRAERGVAAEEHFRIGRDEGLRIDLRHVPLVELDAAVALDPGEGVLLADRDQHVVAGDGLVGFARGHQVAAALGVVFGLHLLEGDADELAADMLECHRHHEIEDRNVLVKGVFLFPGARLHFLEAGTHDHLDVFAAEPARGAAAIHRGVAAAEHDDAPADLLDMAERDRRQPFDADVDIGGGFLAAGDVELAAARGAGADEDRVVILVEQLLQAVDAMPALELDAEVEDVIGLLVDHRCQAGGILESGSASCRPPWDRHRTRCSDSRAARGRARPQAKRDRRRRARCACRSSPAASASGA